MGLTRPRAAQIFNLDYKQATRVVTTTNITLAGGAPSLVDGVSLSAGDRVLVTAQDTGSQNGLYLVTTLGSGSNGTWARTSDGNENGEIEAGMIVMVTEGVIYADTQWKLITDEPITINTTALTFTQNYMANSISGGTSNVVVNSNAAVTISSAGTANVAIFNATAITAAANINPSANVTYSLGNTTNRWKDIWLSNSTIYMGNINLAATATSLTVDGAPVLTGGAGGNTVSVAGNITGGNLLTSGLISAASNITGGNLLLSGAIIDSDQLDIQTSAANANIVFTPNGTGNVNITTGLSVTGNIRANSFVGNLAGTANVANYVYVTESPDDNVAYNLPYVSPSGAANAYRQIYSDDTGITFNPSTNILTVAAASHATSMSTPNVATTTTTGTTSLFTTISSGTLNMMTGQTSGPLTIGGAAATGAINIGRSTANQTIAIGNGVTASGSAKTIDIGTLGAANSNTNINIGPVAGNSTVQFLANALVAIANTSGSALSVAGNITGANIRTAGLVSATGSVTAASVVGGVITGTSTSVTGTTTAASVVGGVITGTSTSVTGTTTAASVVGGVMTGTSSSVTGTVTGASVVGGVITGTSTSVTGTQTAASTVGGVITGSSSSVTGTQTAASTVGGVITGSSTSVTGTTTAASVVGGVITGTSLSASGNVTGGNILTGGIVSATGNVSGGNLNVTGNIVDTGALTIITGSNGNIALAPNGTGIVTASGNISAAGNVTGGNVLTAGIVSATGNVVGSTIIASGNIVVQSRQQVKFYDTDSSNFISLRAPTALTGDYLLTLPTGYGNADQVLSTNGSGNLAWVDQSGGGGSSATSYPNSTVSPVPGSTGNFDLTFNFVQTSQEIPFETSATDAFGVNLGEVYSMMDPGGEVLEPVDLGVLT